MGRSPNPELIERRRRQILDAAVTCFRRRGFHQASMQEICAEAQLSAGAVYRYFKSKTDIIIAIAEDEHAEAAQRFVEVERSGSTIEAIEGLCAEALAKAEAFGGALVADVLAEASRNPELAARLAETERHFRPLIEDALRRGVEAGEVDPNVDPAAIARILETYLDGFIVSSVIPSFRDRRLALEDIRLFLTRLMKADRPVPAKRKLAPVRTEETRS